MKRIVIVVSIALMAALAASPAMAKKDEPAKSPSQVTQNYEASQKFLADTAATRQDLAAKNAEYQALMRSQNPDPAKAASLAKDIFALRETLREKAKASGFGPGSGYGPGNCPGYGAGSGCGFGGAKGYGMGGGRGYGGGCGFGGGRCQNI